MQIFIFSYDLRENAEFYCDAHIRKIPIEICQMLGNCFTEEQLKSAPLTQKGEFRKHTHFKHPLSKWVRNSQINYSYAWWLAFNLFNEYTYRFNKVHFTFNFLLWLGNQQTILPVSLNKSSDFIQAIPNQYKQLDTCQAYRNYFNAEKHHIFKWTKRPIPKWIKKGG